MASHLGVSYTLAIALALSLLLPSGAFGQFRICENLTSECPAPGAEE